MEWDIAPYAFGQVMTIIPFEAQAGSNDLLLDLKEWSSGIYYINAQYSGGLVTEKLVITK